MDNNLANTHRPVYFSEYKSQNSAVRYLSSIIRDNKHPNGILISGLPGTGKTSLAHLYVKATLCENREENTYEPCGECASCKLDIEKESHPNITYYRITEASVFKEAVGDLINISKSRPTIVNNNLRADNQRRFIIIDELQLCTRQSISPFLDSLEFASPSTTVILISMDLCRLDSTVLEAIESRCIELSLDKLSTEIIAERLQEKYNDLHPSSAYLIAYLAKGNMRKAWSYLEFFATQLPIIEITEEFISNQKIGGLSGELYNKIIDSLESKTWEYTTKLINKISGNNEQVLDYFLDQLICEDLTIKGIELLSNCSFWLQTKYKIPLLALFKPFQGCNLKQYDKSDTISPKVTTGIESIKSSPQELKKTTISIENQLMNITGKQVYIENKVYPSLSFCKWSEFIKYYDNNN